MRRLLVYAGLYVLAAGIWFAISWASTSYQRDLGAALSKSGAVTTATVTISEPENHNSICFTYSVNGVTYAGCDSAHFGKLARELPRGNTTLVTYDTNNPTVYCACPADSLVRKASEAPIVGALWMGTATWTILVLRGRKSLIPWLALKLP